MAKKFWKPMEEPEPQDTMTVQEAQGLMAVTDFASVTVETGVLGLTFLLGSVYTMSMMQEAAKDGRTFSAFDGTESEMTTMLTILMESEGFARGMVRLSPDEIKALARSHSGKVAEARLALLHLAKNLPNQGDELDLAMGKTIRDKTEYLRDLALKLEQEAEDAE